MINVLNNETFREGRCYTTFIEETPELFLLPESQDRATKILEFLGNKMVNVQKAVLKAREQVANALGAKVNEIYFTAGGSESDNWAIRGCAQLGEKKGKKHIITTAFEHHAVLHTCQYLEKLGFEVTYLL